MLSIVPSTATQDRGEGDPRHSAEKRPSRRRPRADGCRLECRDNDFYARVRGSTASSSPSAAERLWLRGVTYGTFAPDATGRRFGTPRAGRARLRRDGRARHQRRAHLHGAARWLLDGALRHGLWVMVGPAVGAARRVPRRARAAPRRSRRGCASRRARLRRPPGAALRTRSATRSRRRSCAGTAGAGSSASSSGCTTPCKPKTRTRSSPTSTSRPPSTCGCRSSTSSAFNVYLETPASVDAVPRAAAEPRRREAAADGRDRASTAAATGCGSRRQRSAGRSTPPFAAGCAGTFVFAWTDEWHRGGDEIVDWDFGLTDRAAAPQAGARGGARGVRRRAVSAAAGQRRASPSSSARTTARATLGECLDGARRARYPDYEVIVVDDGSTDATRRDRRGVRRAAHPHGEQRPQRRAQHRPARGARARSSPTSTTTPTPIRDWLRYLVHRVPHHRPRRRRRPEPAARRATGRSPTASPTRPAGRCTCCSPTSEAEHIPGCNMAFRRDDAARDRRLRPAVPHRRRRRRRLLAPADRGRRSASIRRRVVWHHRRATRFAPTGASSAATARPRRCSSGSGRRSTRAAAT